MPGPVAIALGCELVDIGATFTPNGEPLEVAVGWAGSEAASDPATLRLLADRALEVAQNRELRVVDAEELSQHSAATIELTAAYGVADAVDALDSRGDHSVRVSEYAADLARELQLEPNEVAEVGLAARLHDVGKAVYGEDAFDPESDRFEEARTTHPERGEAFVLTNAGAAVAAIVRAHHERWDGTGHPDGKATNDIPLGARILAVAHRYDELANAGTSQVQIEETLRSEGGEALDPDLVEAAIALFGRG
jgi:two-component system, cell cycle response regulator